MCFRVNLLASCSHVSSCDSSLQYRPPLPQSQSIWGHWIRIRLLLFLQLQLDNMLILKPCTLHTFLLRQESLFVSAESHRILLIFYVLDRWSPSRETRRLITLLCFKMVCLCIFTFTSELSNLTRSSLLFQLWIQANLIMKENLTLRSITVSIHFLLFQICIYDLYNVVAVCTCCLLFYDLSSNAWNVTTMHNILFQQWTL